MRPSRTSFFAALDKEGSVALPRFTGENFVWWTASLGDLTEAQIIGMGASVANSLKAPLSLKMHDYIVEDDRVAVAARSRGKAQNGSICDNQYYFKLFFQNRKIVKVKEYHDTKHAFETWSPFLQL